MRERVDIVAITTAKESHLKILYSSLTGQNLPNKVLLYRRPEHLPVFAFKHTSNPCGEEDSVITSVEIEYHY